MVTLRWCVGRDRSELQSRVADLEQEKAGRASCGDVGLPKMQQGGEQHDGTLGESPRAERGMAQDHAALEATLGLRARRFRAPPSTEGDNDRPTAKGAAACTETSMMEGWAKAVEAGSGRVYFCPVKLTATGEPAWELPEEGLIISCMPAQQMRRDEEDAVRSAAMRKLVGAMIVLLFSVALSGTVFFEYNFGMLSKMIRATL